MYMRKTMAVAVLCLFIAVTMLSAQEEKKAEMADAHKELMAAAERGKALFGDTKLGTTGMSCSSCHMEGGTKPGMELYRNFRGRDPSIEPLLERRGLTGE